MEEEEEKKEEGVEQGDGGEGTTSGKVSSELGAQRELC